MALKTSGMQKLLLVPVLIALILGNSSFAYNYNDHINPQELVTRCFQSLGNIRLSFLDPRRSHIQTFNDALKFCDQLIDAPTINIETGDISSSIPEITKDEAVAVVRRFQQYHESYFVNDKFENISEDTGKTRMLYDTALPAAYFTYALFNKNPNYQLAVNENSSLKVVRSDNPKNRYGSVYNKKTKELFLETYDMSNYSNGEPKMMESVDRGLFSGIRKSSKNPPAVLSQGTGKTDYFEPINPHETLGGGFMGTPAFIILNLGLNNMTKITGSMTLPRRIGKNIMDVAFCRSGPYLTNEQVPNEDVATQNEPPSFRNNKACNSCHSTQDPLSYAFRNVRYSLIGRTENFKLNDFERCRQYSFDSKKCIKSTLETDDLSVLERTKNSVMIDGQPSNQFNWIIPSTGKSDFYMSKNYPGRLLFTSAFGGTFQSKFNVLSDQFTGNNQLTDLGSKIAKSDDYYLCGALKYSEMLLGIHIDLKAEDLPELLKSSALQTNLWNNLKELVTSRDPEYAFNALQPNPKNLLKNLIRLPEFKSGSFGRKSPGRLINVTQIHPSEGFYDEETPVTLTGNNFTPEMSISIGGGSCTQLKIKSPTELTCNAPPSPQVGMALIRTTLKKYTTVSNSTFTYRSNLSWNSGIQKIFNKCTDCHGVQVKKSGLNFSYYDGIIESTNPLTSIKTKHGDPILQITNGKIDVENSLIYKKIMENMGNLNDGEKKEVYHWLQKGAPER